MVRYTERIGPVQSTERVYTRPLILFVIQRLQRYRQVDKHWSLSEYNDSRSPEDESRVNWT